MDVAFRWVFHSLQANQSFRHPWVTSVLQPPGLREVGLWWGVRNWGGGGGFTCQGTHPGGHEEAGGGVCGVA